MTEMTRSKTQVLRGYLPGQTFQHQDETIVKVLFLDAYPPYNLNDDQLFENLEQRLARWKHHQDDDGNVADRAPGFPELPRFRSEYSPREPGGSVYFAVWPMVMRCVNPRCEKVREFRDESEWNNTLDPQHCDSCHMRREQMPYLQVHTCGRDAPIMVEACRHHGNDHVYLKDEGSFETSTWRCRAGNHTGEYVGNMRFRPCGCGQGGGYVSRTIRQDDRFITHTFSFVSFDPQAMTRLQRAQGADRVVVGHYLGVFDDYEQAMLDASRDPAADDLTAKWRERQADMRRMGWSEEDIATMAKRMGIDSPAAVDELAQLVPQHIVAEVFAQQRARERTLIFAGQGRLKAHRLADFRDEATRRLGGYGAADVLRAAEDKARQFGFSDLLVVENFPVALVAYGYSRLGRSPRTALLKAFPTVTRGPDRDKTPIYVANSRTEAVFVELDALRVRQWLIDNGKLAPDAIELPDVDERDRRKVAKAGLLIRYHEDPAAQELITLLVHTISHALIRNLGERAGFAENTMAEFLIPDMLTFGLYADTHQEFTLGALVSLVEHRLGEWLDAAREGARNCPWDPQCAKQDGACMSCLHTSFGCDLFNEGLNRSVLFGAPSTHALDVKHGFWVWTAS